MYEKKTRANFFGNFTVQRKHQLLRMAVSILIGLGLATLLIVLTSERPKTSLNLFFFAPLQNVTYFSFWIQKAIPIMFTGVAVCIMFSANQFNLGLEGAFLFGGMFGGFYVNYFWFLDKPIPGIIVGCLIGGFVGALITMIPAILERLFGASIMVTSLMMKRS